MQLRLLHIPFILLTVFWVQISTAQNDSIAPIATEPLKRGIYMSHQDFVANTPSDTHSFYLQEKARKKGLWEGTFNRIPRYSKNGRKSKHIWGFSDGEKAHIYHEKEYFPITVEGHKMLFYGYGLSEASESEKAMAWAAAFMGGLAGTLIYELSSNAVSKREAKTQHKLFYIDQFTGTVIPDYLLMKSGYDFFNPTCQFFIYRYEKESIITDSVTFILNDQQEIPLGPNGIYESEISLSHAPHKLCTADSNSCFEFTNKTYEPTYISVSYDAISNGWKIEEVDQSTGLWFLNKTDKKQKKSDRK